MITVGNTVGSLSAVQQSIIIGTLLGDGTMRCKANALLEINHSIRQRGYVDWKYQAVAQLVSTPPKARKGNGTRIAYRFVTRAVPELTFYFRLFYGDSGKKRVPDLKLEPLSLAVWFMDDGSKSRSAVYLNTQQFEEADQMKLLRMLEQQWDIKATLNRDKIYKRIRVSTGSTPLLVSIIEPHLLPDFRYKLPQVTP